MDRGGRLKASLCGMIEWNKDTLRSLGERLEANSPEALLEQGHRRCDEMEERLDRAAQTFLEQLLRDRQGWAERLDNAAIPSILKRGYALVRRNEKLVSSVSDLGGGEELRLTFKDGEVTVKVLDIHKSETYSTTPSIDASKGDEKDE
ncbi:MAG: hypothetical protein KAT70_05785, partial [Thermoplasmata archaeon]|nr:hypothetical protein [Thermoplasmata archaeon]